MLQRLLALLLFILLLTPSGPVLAASDPNDAEAGRAKNRRVERVKQ